MTNDDWKTLRVPEDDYEAAKEQKEAAGRTWGEQIVRQDDGQDATDAEAIAAAVRAELDTDAPDVDDVTGAIQTIEERTGRIERLLEDLQR